MIPRYSRPDMAAVWSDENKYRIWYDIEAYACEAQAILGVIPQEAVDAVRLGAGKSDPAKIDEIERVTKHDVIAFLTDLAAHVGEHSRFVHQGMTSSDVLDTCLSVQLNQASGLLLKQLDELLDVLKRRAFETKNMPCIGRSHGIHAEPVTMGLKFARFYAEMKRAKVRLEAARADVAVCAVSGAVGTFAQIDPFVQRYVAEKLGLREETVSTQVIPRDRHAYFFATLAVIGSSVENIAVEIRHLQRTEVGEAEEYFSPGQKGSSAMPHKRNPVLSENLTGLARLLRGYALPAMENVALWHERDISHSSVERMIAPDATVVLDFALGRLTQLISGLVCYPERMRANLEASGGLAYSQRVLLALTQKGLSREASYAAVQRCAMSAWRGEGGFFQLLLTDPDVSAHIKEDELKELFNPEFHLRHVEHIFLSVFE